MYLKNKIHKTFEVCCLYVQNLGLSKLYLQLVKVGSRTIIVYRHHKRR